MGGKQGGDGRSPKRRLAGEGDVVHHVALLLLQRGGYGHQPFHEPAPGGTVAAEAPLALGDPRPDGQVGRIVGRLGARDPHEGPERGRERQDLPTCRGGGGMEKPTLHPTSTIASPSHGQRPPALRARRQRDGVADGEGCYYVFRGGGCAI